MDFEVRNTTGLIREKFDDFKEVIKKSVIEQVTLAAGDVYLAEYAEKLKKDGSKYSQEDLKKHVQHVFDALYENGMCTNQGMKDALAVIYPVIEDKKIISETILKHEQKFPEVSLNKDILTFSKESLDENKIAHNKAVVYGHIVLTAFESISKRFHNILATKIQ